MMKLLWGLISLKVSDVPFVSLSSSFFSSSIKRTFFCEDSLTPDLLPLKVFGLDGLGQANFARIHFLFQAVALFPFDLLFFCNEFSFSNSCRLT